MRHLPTFITVVVVENTEKNEGKISRSCKNPCYLHLLPNHLKSKLRICDFNFQSWCGNFTMKRVAVTIFKKLFKPSFVPMKKILSHLNWIGIGIHFEWNPNLTTPTFVVDVGWLFNTLNISCERQQKINHKGQQKSVNSTYDQVYLPSLCI